MGEGMTIRRYQGSKRIESRKTFRYQEIRLESVNPDYQSIVLKDVESVDFKIIGRYVSGV
jgi:SOS-response transcriptional repressor LexA